MCDCDVNPATGEVTQYVTDFVLPGILPLHFQRSYSSTSPQEGPLGYGWNHNLALSARLSGNELTLPYCEGKIVRQSLPPPGESVVDDGSGLMLAWDKRELTVAEANQNKLVFSLADGRGLLLRKEDPCGNAVRFTYDARGRLEEIRDTAERHIAFEHDARSRLKVIRLRPGVRATEQPALCSFEYSSEGDLVAVADRAGAATRYEYQDHLLTCVTDRVGNPMYFQYDAKRRCIRTWRAGGLRFREIRHHAARHMTAAINSQGWSTLYRINDKDQIEEEVDPLGRVKKDVYSVYGPLVVNTGDRWLPEVTTFAKDERLLSVCRNSGITKFQLGEQGKPIAITNPAGDVEQNEYDQHGNLVRSVSPLGAEWKFEYDEHGYLLRVIDPEGYQLREKHSEGPPVRTEEDGLGVRHACQFDAQGKAVALEDGKSRRTEVEYDRACRPVRVAFPDDSEVTYTYDAEGRLLSRTNEMKQTATYQYDATGALVEAVEADGRTKSLRYDSEGHLVAVTNGKREEAQMVYDQGGRPVRLTAFDGVTWQYVYDERDQVGRILDAAGKALANLSYDDAGRLVRKQWVDAAFLAVSYGRNGNIVSVENANGVLQFEWDADMRIVKETFGETVLEFEHDRRGRRVALRSNRGREIRYEWDPRGRLRALTDHNAAGAFRYEYKHDKTDLVEECRFPSGLVQRFRYDRLDRLIRRTVHSAGNVELTDRKFVYDDLSRLVRMEDRQWGFFEYRYGPGERLLGVLRSGEPDEQYAYDAEYNLTLTRSGAAIKIAPGNRATSCAGETFTYDDNGNLTSWKHDGGETRYEWHLAGELLRVIAPDGTVTEFSYDPLGRRVSRTHAGARTEFTWDGATLLEEHDADSATDYLFLPGSFLPAGLTQGGRHNSCSCDHLGTATELFDQNGNIAWAAHLSAYGEILETLKKDLPWPFRLPGQYSDDMTGLCCMLRRYYDPRLARFLSPDPAGLDGGTNPYLYVRNPLSWINPFASLDEPLAFRCCRSARAVIAKPAMEARVLERLSEPPAPASPLQRRKRSKAFREQCGKTGFPMPQAVTTSLCIQDQARRVREMLTGGQTCAAVLPHSETMAQSFGTQIRTPPVAPVPALAATKLPDMSKSVVGVPHCR
jgi:RHS repeat-associated protein